MRSSSGDSPTRDGAGTVRTTAPSGKGVGDGATGNREAILEATIRLVAQGGLRALTFRAVAGEVGVTHPLVVHHFGTRDALIEEAVRHSMTRTESIAKPVSTTGRIEDYAPGTERIATDEPHLQAFQYELILEARRNERLRPYIEKMYGEWHDMTRRSFEQMGFTDPGPLAHLAFAALDGLVLQQLILGTEQETAESVELLRSMLGLLLREEHSAQGVTS